MKHNWKFSRNVYGDEINALNCRSIWYWGSGKHFWQWHHCPCLNRDKYPGFEGTKKELREFLNGGD